MNKRDFVEKINGKMIISCQAVGSEPLNDTNAITLMAESVIQGGAEFLRISQYDHIKSIKNKFKNIPSIGLIKKIYKNSEVFITPTKIEIDKLLSLNIECIALDGTTRKRPCDNLEELVNYIRIKNPEIAIMTDCSNIEDVVYCNKLKVDLIGTTLRGYTKDTINKSNIDENYSFVKECLNVGEIPIIAEGGIWEPFQVRELLEIGCHSVVGSAITRPKEITRKFMKELSS